MKEIEILVSFDDTKEEILEKLSKFKFAGEKEIYDTYYVDELRDNLKPEADLRMNETFRVRRTGDDCLITYKKNNFEGKRWIYSDEYETTAKDYKMVEKIVEMLGLKAQVVVHNKRKVYKHNEYEIVLEEVEDLGLFIEVEIMISDDKEDVIKVKEKIRQFINELGLKNVREFNVGKNQLLLSKKLNRNDIEVYI